MKTPYQFTTLCRVDMKNKAYLHEDEVLERSYIEENIVRRNWHNHIIM